MEIVIDVASMQQQLAAFFSQPADVILWRLIVLFGWIPLGIVLIWGFLEMWINYIQDLWGSQQKFVLLAIDVPRNNAQSPKAVENMFTYFLGAHGSLNLIEIYWIGKYQLSFSFEIVSIEGYTQFLIHAPEPFRDLIEAAVYSQYPDAEITEVEDYAAPMPRIFPDPEWDIWGAEFILVKDEALPIKTYKAFEHQLGDPALTYRDPISSLMSLCSSLGRGEQLWYQIICTPTDFKWTEIGDNAIKKILKEKVPENRNAGDAVVDSISGIFNWIFDFILEIFSMGSGESAKQEVDQFRIFNLKPKERKQIEMIQEKISKAGFLCKIRMIYWAKKDVMNKPKVANGFIGYMKQYADLDLNNLKPDTKVTQTSASYFFVEYRLKERKRKIVYRYKNRSGYGGRQQYILNIEELASLWHFPIEGITAAPLLIKAPGRKAVPPSALPLENIEQEESEIIDELFLDEKDKPKSAKPEPKAAPKSEERDFFSEEILSKQAEVLKKPNNFRPAEAIPKGAPPANLPFA